MAQNLTRNNNSFQKKAISVAFIHDIDYTDLTADSGNGSILVVLPKHVVVTHVGVIEESAANVGAEATITLGGDALVTDGAIDASLLFTFVPQHHEAGGDLIIKAGSTPPSAGTFSFFFFYIEHNKNTGEYTNFSNN